MKGRRKPNRKEPWRPEFFDMYVQAYDLNQLYNTQFLFYMVISYFGILRISELRILKTEDITLDEENHRLKLHIRFSKTNQTGVGSDIFIYENDKNYSPYKLYKMLNKNFENNEYIVDLMGSQLRHHLKIILKHIGLNDTEYSWHSFRRGGAYQASLNGVPDCENKKHGRWLSEAYIRYVDVNPEKAGLNIINKI
ncbi:hypothetical protein M9Y10_031092 [Tritrichomonas musculus]|uniref:Tyr recombinase domain-containing protein n=1 Tax=Tritrichomonas musculus TaxID=1915356 RepID=A0ABR2H2R9_9EUKA